MLFVEEFIGLEGRILLKRRDKRAFVLVFVTMVLLGAFSVIYADEPNVPHVANAMWVEGPYPFADCDGTDVNITTADLSVGQRFNVTVWVNITSVPSGNALVGAWQVYMIYEFAYLDWIRAGYTNATAGKSDFFEEINTYPGSPSEGNQDGTHDYVMFGEMWNPTAPDPNPKKSVPDYGSLAWFEFEIVSAPDKYDEILSLIDISTKYPASTWIADDDATKVPMTVSDCPYHYRWAPPITNPHLAVDPITTTFDKYTNHTCELFNVSINILNLDSAWGLTNVSFSLTYDPTYIVVNNVYIDTSVWDGLNTGYTDMGTYIDFFANTTQSVYAPPPLTVAIVEFHLIYHPSEGNIVALDFLDVVIYDHFGEIPTTLPENGRVIIEGLGTLQDVAVTNVTVCYGASLVHVGETACINVTVANEGDLTETFNVSTYWNTTEIQTIQLVLANGTSTSITFNWTTTSLTEYQNYNITAYAHPVLGETDLADNNFTYGIVTIVHKGDVNMDRWVDQMDLYLIALAYGTKCGDAEYIPERDVNCDGWIDQMDLYLTALHYGEHQ